MRLQRMWRDWYWNPWLALEDARREFDRTGRFAGAPVGTDDAGATMPVDAYDAGQRFVIKVDVPGVAPEDVEVSVEDTRVLSIKVRRPGDRENGAEYLCCERPAGQVTRALELPVAVDAAHVTAILRQGVLEISLPKSPAVGVNKVAVATA